jgi:hypothetical protein
LRSKLRRQLPLVRRAARAVVVFDQTSDMPLLRGKYNVHIDRKWPGLAQVERDGFGPRVGFVARWLVTAVHSLAHAATRRRYRSRHRYG